MLLCTVDGRRCSLVLLALIDANSILSSFTGKVWI